MAGRRLELTVVFSRAGGLALAVAALAVLILTKLRFIDNNLVFYALSYGDMLCGGYLLWLQVRWLCLGRDEQPGHVMLLVMIAVEWMVACVTVGTAIAAITADVFALQHHYCDDDERAGCVLYLVAAAMACVAGALAAVSALGMLWIHGSRFRPAHAP